MILVRNVDGRAARQFAKQHYNNDNDNDIALVSFYLVFVLVRVLSVTVLRFNFICVANKCGPGAFNGTRLKACSKKFNTVRKNITKINNNNK